MNQMDIKYPTCLLNIPNGRKIYQHFPIRGSPKFTQIFGLKSSHLATLTQIGDEKRGTEKGGKTGGPWKELVCMPWRHGIVVIASDPGT
jgi:hypothetical protein